MAKCKHQLADSDSKPLQSTTHTRINILKNTWEKNQQTRCENKKRCVKGLFRSVENWACQDDAAAFSKCSGKLTFVDRKIDFRIPDESEASKVHSLVDRFETNKIEEVCIVSALPIELKIEVTPLIEKFDKNEFVPCSTTIKRDLAPCKKIVVPKNVVICLNSVIEEKMRFYKQSKR